MKSDLTCPVEIVRVTIQRETEDTNENGQILCLIDFFNLSDKVIDSIQMNIICFDAEDQRLGGRLVRAGAHGEPRENFSGAFAPEHVENVARVEAAVEKVWYQDGVIWRREERNVREYSPNALPPGRELDRLRSVAGPDAVGYAREDDTVWLCVCGRANRTSDDRCLRCGRDRAHTVKAYSFAAIDSTLGRKERMLEEKTRETLRRSSEQTVQQMKAVQKKQRKQKKRLRTVITLLAFVALLLAAARWGAPYALSLYAGDKLDRGLAADAKELYALIDRYWPDEFGAAAGMDAAEQKIIDGLMNVGTDSAYEQAAKRAEAIGDTQRAEKAIIARAKLAIAGGDTDTAEALLTPLAANEEARGTLRRMIYDVAKAAKEHLEYPTAIERFGSLGDYEDAAAQKTDCIYLYGRQLMREGQYQAACDQFMLVSDTGDAIALIRQCRYALGLEKQQAGEYEAAAALFESLGVYEDAQTRGQLCRYTAGTNALSAGELEKAAEQLLAAGDYKDAPQKFADVATTLGNAALEAGDNQTAIGWLEQLPESEETRAAINRAVYAYAEQLVSDGQKEAAAIEFYSLGGYEDAMARGNALEYELAMSEKAQDIHSALDRLEALGDYGDAAAQADECRYEIAKTAMNAGELQDALDAFEALGDAQDAPEQAQRCRYLLAQRAVSAGEYDEAIALYEACGAYLDAEDGAMQARYAKAAALFDAQEYEAAAKAFAELGSYEDAKQRVTDSEDAWLSADYNSARMDTELGNYAAVIDELAAYYESELPPRYAQMHDMYESACLARAQELTALGKPLDALPILKRIEGNKNAKKRMEAYVYQLIGRWKDTRGTEYVFREDGSCCIAGKEGYFGGSGYEITVGDEPYPTKGEYSVVSVRGKTVTLRGLQSGRTIRLSYLGEPTDREESADNPEN
ncbi:MAG: tetratricopeptide repeat protein [Christensenellales bacterium]